MTLRGKHIYFLSCGTSKSKLPSLFETYPTYQYHMEQRNQVTDAIEEQVFHPSLAPGRDAILTRNRERVFRPKNFYDSLVSGALSILSAHHPPSVQGGEHSFSFLTGIFIPRETPHSSFQVFLNMGTRIHCRCYYVTSSVYLHYIFVSIHWGTCLFSCVSGYLSNHRIIVHDRVVKIWYALFRSWSSKVKTMK